MSKSGSLVVVRAATLGSRCDWRGRLGGDAGRMERAAGVWREGWRPRRGWRRGGERGTLDRGSGSLRGPQPPPARPGGGRAADAQSGMGRRTPRSPGYRPSWNDHALIPQREWSSRPRLTPASLQITSAMVTCILAISVPSGWSRTRPKRLRCGRNNVSWPAAYCRTRQLDSTQSLLASLSVVTVSGVGADFLIIRPHPAGPPQ